MSWTKRQFVNQALEELGITTYEFDLQPEQIQAALKKLDAMMGTWNARGIRVGFPIPSSPEDSDLDTETNVPDSANEAICTNLALRVAPAFGKTVAPETRLTAYMAYTALLAHSAQPIERTVAYVPAGAGNKGWMSSEFIGTPDDVLEVGKDAELDLE